MECLKFEFVHLQMSPSTVSEGEKAIHTEGNASSSAKTYEEKVSDGQEPNFIPITPATVLRVCPPLILHRDPTT